MVYLVGRYRYPNDKDAEVTKVGLELIKQFPEDKSLGTLVIPLATRATDRGVEGMIITEVFDGKFKDAMMRGNKMLAMFNGIEGFRYELEVWGTAAEAFSIINMKSPL